MKIEWKHETDCGAARNPDALCRCPSDPWTELAAVRSELTAVRSELKRLEDSDRALAEATKTEPCHPPGEPSWWGYDPESSVVRLGGEDECVAWCEACGACWSHGEWSVPKKVVRAALTRRNVHGKKNPTVSLEHLSCPDVNCCACECHACKRAWFAAGRPTPAHCSKHGHGERR